MEKSTSPEMLIFLLRNGTAVLNVGRSKAERDSKKVFVMMRGIYRRETKEIATTHPAATGAVQVVLIDSG